MLAIHEAASVQGYIATRLDRLSHRWPKAAFVRFAANKDHILRERLRSLELPRQRVGLARGGRK
jgi:hypothetical protein